MQSKLRPMVGLIPAMQIHGFTSIYLDSSWPYHSGLVTSITVIPSLLSGMGSGTKNLGLETNFHTSCAAYWYTVGNYDFRKFHWSRSNPKSTPNAPRSRQRGTARQDVLNGFIEIMNTMDFVSNKFLNFHFAWIEPKKAFRFPLLYQIWKYQYYHPLGIVTIGQGSRIDRCNCHETTVPDR